MQVTLKSVNWETIHYISDKFKVTFCPSPPLTCGNMDKKGNNIEEVREKG
jgi:hypothetical protein